MTQYKILDAQLMRAIEEAANKAREQAKTICTQPREDLPLSVLLKIVKKIQSSDQSEDITVRG